MSNIALWAKVEELDKRLKALEHAQTPASSALRRNNAMRQVEGCRLRGAIERILATHPDYSAKHVLKALAAVDLGRPAMPSVRTVQWHVKALRNTPALRTSSAPQG